jgi:hypothetical protein
LRSWVFDVRFAFVGKRLQIASNFIQDPEKANIHDKNGDDDDTNNNNNNNNKTPIVAHNNDSSNRIAATATVPFLPSSERTVETVDSTAASTLDPTAERPTSSSDHAPHHQSQYRPALPTTR